MSARTRVAYFVPPSPRFAGIEHVVHEIATGLAMEDGAALDVHVVFASHYAEDVLVDPPYTKHVLGVDRLRQLTRALRACVASNDFDVLVVPQVEASVIAWLAVRGLRLPVFITHLHGNPRVEERDGTLRTRLAFALFRRVVARRIAGVLTVSPSLARYAATTLARQTTVRYVPNPARELPAPSSRIPGTGPFRLLNVGRMSRQKGQDLLLRALARGRSQLPPVTLTLVGTGPDEPLLRELTEELGLAEIVTFTGYAFDPTDHFRAADCFVLSSRWEGFGMVLLEALHFGLPLLATDCEFGPADVITAPVIGHLVAPDSVAALAEGLRAVVGMPVDPHAEEARRALAASHARREVAGCHITALRELADRFGVALTADRG